MDGDPVIVAGRKGRPSRDPAFGFCPPRYLLRRFPSGIAADLIYSTHSSQSIQRGVCFGPQEVV